MAKLKTGRHTSALKANRQSARHRWANAAVNDKVKAVTKSLLSAISAKDAAKTKELLPKVVSGWTRLGHKNVVHHVKASRKIARLSRAAHRVLSPSA